MKFKSKRDLSLTLVVWVPLLFVFGIGVFTLLSTRPGIGLAILVVFLTFIIPLFMLWVWLATYYVLDDRNLIIRSGPYKKVIPLSDIRSVEKTRNPLSAPALSLDRLEIKYGKYGFALISPEDRDAFIEMFERQRHQMKGTS